MEVFWWLFWAFKSQFWPLLSNDLKKKIQVNTFNVQKL